jgi:hypothetical protein
MNSGTGATDSVNYVGNEVTNTGLQMGNFSLAGSGYFTQGNNIKGTITPSGTTVQEQSLYLASTPGFWPGNIPWPHIGSPYPYNQSLNAAAARLAANSQTDCRSNPEYVNVPVLECGQSLQVYPNPAKGTVTFAYHGAGNKPVLIYITDIMGKRVARFEMNSTEKVTWNTSGIPAGVYLYKLQAEDIVINTGKVIITE